FAAEVTALADQDERLVLLMGDIGNRLFNDFKARHPDRFFNCGVAEANMTGLAAGTAACGLRPVTYTLAPFVTTRCPEQIGRDVCVLATGTVVPLALETARELARQGVSAAVVDCHTVKPLDEDRLGEAFARFPLVATVEEHSLLGGLGGAVAEWLADHPHPR